MSDPICQILICSVERSFENSQFPFIIDYSFYATCVDADNGFAKRVNGKTIFFVESIICRHVA